MNYSSAWFQGDPTGDLRAAQHAKVRRALEQAGVQAGDRVLEIGCGWGALAEMATTEMRASVTGVTLSTEQLAFARQRMERLGTSAQADLRLQDYRDINDGPYDAVCSIEMVEAVAAPTGPPTSSRCTGCSSRAGAPASRASSSTTACSSATSVRPTSSSSTSFPVAACPCPREFRREAEAAGLQVQEEFAFGADYAETLRRWRERFLAHARRSCGRALTSASCTSGSSTWRTARRRSPWATSTWCNTPLVKP